MLSDWLFQVVEVPITVSLDAYTANDVVGGTLSSNAITQITGNGGFIAWVRLVDDATQAEAYTLYVYSENPSTIADGDEFVPTEADYLKEIGKIDIAATDYNTAGTEADCARVMAKDTITDDVVYFPLLPNGRLYFRLVPSATPDYADADDLTLHIGLFAM